MLFIAAILETAGSINQTVRKFYQISQDHVLGRSLFGKAPLTQYLGMEEENLQLEPSISRQEIKIGDRFLLCSDGITDMLSDGEIADILSRDIPVAKIRRDSRRQSSEKGWKR